MFESSLYDCGPCIELIGGLVRENRPVAHLATLPFLSLSLAKWSTSAAQPGDPLSKVCPLNQ